MDGFNCQIIKPDNASIIVNPDPSIVYDYQDILRKGLCSHCQKPLKWNLTPLTQQDDRFCFAICCATRFSMVPEKVRVIPSFAFPLEEEEKEEAVDSDFLRELEALQFLSGVKPNVLQE